MNDKPAGGVHWSFRVITVVTLIWNVLGVVNFFAQMDPEVLAAYRESERSIVQGRPAWATAGFALAVFGGTLGGILLLLRKTASHYAFIASLVGVVVTTSHTLAIGIHHSPGEMLGIILMPVAVAVFLIWYAKLAERKQWIS